MSESDLERDQPASARQRERFADRGETVRSRELGMALALAASTVALIRTGSHVGSTMLAAMRGTLGHVEVGMRLWSPARLGAHLWECAGGIMTAAVAATIIASVVQENGRVRWVSPKVDFSRINPFGRLGQLFAPRKALTNIGLAALKVVAVASLCGGPLVKQVPVLLAHVPNSLPAVLRSIGILARALAWRGVGALLVLGAIDYALNWWRLEQRMKMTGQELRDEAKDENGDSRIRGRRRRKHQELVKQRSLKQVPTATVVVVNPTHYAVALRYDSVAMRAPMVVAKGADAWAERLRSIARRHQVPVVSQPALTRALFARVKVGGAIPEELYQAVAVVLAHVMRVGRKGA